MTISSTGIGSGLDVSSIVKQLVAIERQPITQLQSAASTIQTKISAYGQVNSLTSDLADKAAALATPTLWSQGKATSSDEAALKATASSSAATGDYSVKVSQIARAQTLYSQAVAAVPAVASSGSMTIQLQDYGPPPKLNGDAVTVDISANSTLEQVRDRINAANAGVVAAVVRDATGASRLTLTSKSTGVDSQMKITTTGGDLARFAYPPADDAVDDSGDPSTGMKEGQSAQNAKLTINGVPVSSASNQVTAMDGLTLNVVKESDTPVKVSVAPDSDAQKKAVDAFVTAYNALNQYIANQSKYDETSKKGGTLLGDSAIGGVRSRLRSTLLGSSGASSALPDLRSIGFDVQTNGSIKVDSTKLTAALAQPAEMAKVLGNVDEAAPANDGLAVRLRRIANELTGADGQITSRAGGLQSSLKRNQDRQSELEDRVSRTQARLEKQYQTLDSKMSTLNGLSNYMTQQITQLNKRGS